MFTVPPGAARITRALLDVDPEDHVPTFTDKQGQYLAFIRTYTLLNRQAPAEADMQRFFRVTPPSVHRMVVELEARGLITRTPGAPRSIRLAISDDEIPPLHNPQPIRTPVGDY
jgi:DNA-binding MarR family transcriptional regulator